MQAKDLHLKMRTTVIALYKVAIFFPSNSLGQERWRKNLIYRHALSNRGARPSHLPALGHYPEQSANPRIGSEECAL